MMTIALAATGCSAPPSLAPAITLERGVLGDGTASDLWTRGIAVAIGDGAAERLARERRPLGPEELAWQEVLEDAAPRVAEGIDALAAHFDLPPIQATIVAGNRGSSDAFGWVDRYIGINLEAFAETYGPPDDEAVDRMTRIVSHEYMHLMTYAFYPGHRDYRDTPLNRALWTIFFEGIGDFVSLSSRWLPDDGGAYSPVTRETLARLEPIFVERLEALANATPAEEEALREGISMGQFDEKWGSLPLSLWLHSEAKLRGENEALRAMIRGGRDDVLPLALRHIDPGLRPRIQALLDRTGS